MRYDVQQKGEGLPNSYISGISIPACLYYCYSNILIPSPLLEVVKWVHALRCATERSSNTYEAQIPAVAVVIVHEFMNWRDEFVKCDMQQNIEMELESKELSSNLEEEIS